MKNTENNFQHQSTKWYNDRITYLAGFMTPEREQTLRNVLAERTHYITILMENTFHPQNASALVRSCEAFGIQDIHTVETLCKFNPNVRIVRGTDKWIDITKHHSTQEALMELKSAGYRIVATTPHTKDSTPHTFDVEAGKFALVFGTEHAGISQEVMELADEFIQIPMCGFVESLNVSASAAIMVYELAHRMRNSNIKWQLGEHKQSEILFRWAMATVRDSKNILSRYKEPQVMQNNY